MHPNAGSPWPTVGRDNEFRQAAAALTSGALSQGVALTGDSGVGKSTLARALAESLESDGHQVCFALGTETGRDVPLGAFSRAVCIDSAHEPASMLAAAHASLNTDADLVVVVDDAQLLDPLSATLVYQLAASKAARLIVTIRSGEPVLDPIAALLKDRVVLEVHLDAFISQQTGELARRVLGGAVEQRLIDALHRRSGGNLLLLRGLLNAGQQEGVLMRTEDGWQLRGALHADRELSDLVKFRLLSLAPDELSAVEILAVGELLDWELLRGLCDTDAVARLERRGLIQLVPDGPDLLAQLIHPVIGEVAVQLAGVVRTRQVNGLLAQALQHHLQAGRRRTRLPDMRGQIRLAQFIMRSDLQHDLAVIVAAAASAMAISNLGYAEELARFAYDRGAGLPAALALADALSWQGRGDEAEAILVCADPVSADELLTIRWGCLRAGNLFWNCRDVEHARRVLADLSERVDSLVGATFVQAVQVSFAFFTGDLATAIDSGTALCDADVVPLATTWAAVPTAFALAMAGRFGDVERVAAIGLRADAVGASGPQRFAIGLAEVLALTVAGDHPAAERAARRYAAMAAGIPEADAMVQAIFGLLHASRGELAAACKAFRDAVTGLPEDFPSSWLILVTALQAQTAGARGNPAVAAAALRRAEAAYGPQAIAFLPELELARAWERAVAGQVSAGRSHAVRAAELAHRSGMYAAELRALHTAVRLGDRTHAARLAELATALQTPLAAAIATHGRGLANRDGDLLDAAADRFVALEALALAADAAAQAARAHAHGGHRGKELAASARAHWLAEQGDVHTPAIAATAQPLPITDREREVATLVAAGLSNRQIAERLSVSVRTVDGHLYRIFAKLGVERREQLADLFGPAQFGT